MLTVFELSEQVGLFLEPGQDLSYLQVCPAVRGLTDDADDPLVHVGRDVVWPHAAFSLPHYVIAQFLPLYSATHYVLSESFETTEWIMKATIAQSTYLTVTGQKSS